jgi:hypothetical protein
MSAYAPTSPSNSVRTVPANTSKWYACGFFIWLYDKR